ncbi:MULTISPECIES: ammonium transporter [Clostridium]|uniref:Ammonium transporter n=1 Tax=Clostridium butyricum TaxID=1492 RepID=A0AAP9RCJ9_CLOBU|nr:MULTISPECIES: ammonium transporter [Clostridium]APF22699.1 ammonium transporter family protein [Clostridium butyricum]KIU06959.1 ammonium transporter [Clostridium butyricum]MBA8966794.1 Amt family ammonium transporter [Clostridium butyricum]MBA8972141.1 Amt family ammonium transporter [Clostridium butyricum]MBC2426841.1 ammonium transporter [Clostridium butyricum]
MDTNMAIDTLWVLLGGILVFWMQAGFAMVETGFTRSKNAGNIIMKNLMDFALGSLIYWIIGFGLMFGKDAAGIIGIPGFFTDGTAENAATSVNNYAFLFFQTVFCATAATIVSGAMAERTKFISYCIYSAIISAVIYPIAGHWIWGGGWLAQLGFHDFAGSTAVHSIGGWCALVGATILGPRIGKYSKDGKSNAIPGHSLTLGALGVFILWMGWFGFNPGSSLGITGEGALELSSRVFITTNLAAAAAATVTMVLTWVKYGKPDVSMSLNGVLAGLVAITAGCDVVSPLGAAIIGVISAFAMVYGIEFVDKVLKVDDPVGAVGVHCINGVVGTILTGVFAMDGGLFYGGGFKFLGVQCLGVAAVAIWSVATATILFKGIKATIGLRVTREEEIRGLDIEEHGLESSYADFQSVDINM